MPRSTIASGTVRIKLPTRITGGDIHRSQVADARYLDVIWRLDEMSSFDRPRWNDTSSVSGLPETNVREVESVLRARLYLDAP